MTDQASLERGYRRLLACYPRASRRQNGQEILAVLMACAPDGQRRPGLAESADLISSGLRMRLHPSVPRSARTVRAAVRLMYAGAAVSTANLIILLAYIGDIKAYDAVYAVLGRRLTAAQVSLLSHLNSQLNTALITQAVVLALVPVAVWLWMARANGQGRNWARSLSTVLFGLATLDLTGVYRTPGIQLEFVPTMLGATFPVLTWLAGLAVVWLLWRPASSAFFKPQGSTQARHSPQQPSRIRSPHALPPRSF
jgi:hypothetical protein